MATDKYTRSNNNVLTSPTLSVKRIRGNGSTPSQPKSNTSSIVKRRLALSPLSQTEVNNRSFFTSPPQLTVDNSHETIQNENNFSPLHTTTNSNSTIPQDYFHQNNEHLIQENKPNGNDSSIIRTDLSLNDDGLDDSKERIQTSKMSCEKNVISTDFDDNITKRKRPTFSRNVQEENSELPLFGDNDTTVESIPPNNSITDKEEVCVIDFQYPTTIPFPNKKILRHCYNLSMKNENEKLTVSLANERLIPNFLNLSHQQQLKLYGCKLLSLEDVIIPSIAKCHNHELIKHQSKSQREDKEKTLSNTSVIKLCRVVIQTSAVQAIKAIRENRLSWEKDQDLKFLQSLREEKENRKQMRQKRRELKAKRQKEKAESRKMEKENRFRQRKKNWGKNKDLWVEVAKLMTDLGTLRKEEKLWIDALDKMNLNQIATMPTITHELGGNETNEDQISESTSIDHPIINSIADISLAANRINDALGAVVQLMEQSDSIKDEVYNKYGKDHKFHGYRAVKNPKALIRALALC